MIKVDFPAPGFRVKKEPNGNYIFDAIRKQWILLTEEEWVRQNFINYLHRVKNYPLSMIAVEKEIQLGELKKRFDILVYDLTHQPWMLIECKAPDVILNEKVLQQVLRYHIVTSAGLLIITNGNNTFGWMKNENRLEVLERIPHWGIHK
jgi:hypothetical protein